MKKLLGGLAIASLLAMGAGVGVAANTNSAVETRAATTQTVSGTHIKIVDQTNIGWTEMGVNATAHIYNISFAEGSGYTDISQIQSNAMGDSSGTGADHVNAQMHFLTDSAGRQYDITVPWYIDSFDVCFYAEKDGNKRYVFDKSSGTENSYSFSASKGKDYSLYFYSKGGGDDAYWSGIKFVTYISKVEEAASCTYTENKYTVNVDANTVFGGSVTPSIGDHEYLRNQRLTLNASADAYCDFDSWSDSGAAEHVVYVTANAEYTATFTGSAVYLAAKLNAYSESSGTCGQSDRFPACKAYFLALPDGEKTIFQSFASSENPTLKSAYDRYAAWATALSEEPFSSGDGAKTVAPGIEGSVSMPAIIGIAAVGVTTLALGGFFLLRRRKMN